MPQRRGRARRDHDLSCHRCGIAELRNSERELQQLPAAHRHRRHRRAGRLRLLFARFFYLQVVQHEHYHTMAEDNRISIVPIAPNRGLILDRNGVVLARNYSAYTLEITPAQGRRPRAHDRRARRADRDHSRATARASSKLLAGERNAESLPIRTRLTDEEVARFAANRYRFPGVEIKARLFRQYPHGERRLARDRLHRPHQHRTTWSSSRSEGVDANYRGTDYIGKTGLEASYEHELHGTTGFEQVEIDAGGPRHAHAVAHRAAAPATTSC